jgi:putative membrane protein
MIGFIATVVGTGLALWVTSLIYKDISFGANPQITTILIVALIFGVVNAVIKPLIKLLSLPLTLMTFGLFGVVINGGLLILVALVADLVGLTFTVGGFPPDFSVQTIIAAIVGGVVLSIVSTVIGWIPVLNTSK